MYIYIYICTIQAKKFDMELKPCRVSKTGMGGVGKGWLPLAANC